MTICTTRCSKTVRECVAATAALTGVRKTTIQHTACDRSTAVTIFRKYFVFASSFIIITINAVIFLLVQSRTISTRFVVFVRGSIVLQLFNLSEITGVL